MIHAFMLMASQGKSSVYYETARKLYINKITGIGNPAWNGGKIISYCPQCGKEIKGHSSQKRKYCSIKCRGLGRDILGEKHPCYKIGPKMCICEICSNLFYVRQSRENAKYCSKQCMIIGRKDQVEHKCEYCGIMFFDKRSKNRKFCSVKCFGKFRSI